MSERTPEAEYSHELPRLALDENTRRQRGEKIKVSMIGLCGCWGCSLSLLDVDERILELLDHITILRSSFTDIKRIPERCTIGFIEGGVANEENFETLQHYRENCDVLISVGACAIWGGVPAMRNARTELEDCLREAYADSVTRPGEGPSLIPLHDELPRIADRVYPCHEVVKMDYFIPGCPPDGDAIFRVLNDLLNGRPIDLPTSINRYD